MFRFKNLYEAEGASAGSSSLEQRTEPNEVSRSSGMYYSMKQYLDEPSDDNKDKKEDILSDDEKKDNVDNDLNSEKKLEEMDVPTLIQELKKNQQFVSERDTRLAEAENKLKEFEEKIKQQGGDPELAKFIEELSQDFAGAYEKYKGKYKLPDPAIVVKQFNGGSIASRVKQYQDTVLRAKIEKEFGLAEGEFEYDANEAGKADTPSFAWNEATDTKKRELYSEMNSKKAREDQTIAKIETQQNEDKKWIADTYFGGDKIKVDTISETMNNVVREIAEGKASPEKHPFSMRNIIRGFEFDSLQKSAVETAIKDTVEQFAKLGMYLPGNELPVDLSKVGQSASKKPVELASINAMKISPMLQNMDFVINKQ